jgi:hypothetical protein
LVDEAVKESHETTTAAKNKAINEVNYSTKGDKAREVTEDDVTANVIVKVGAWDGVPAEFILSRDARTQPEKGKTIGKKYLKNFRLRTEAGEKMDASSLEHNDIAANQLKFED